MNDMKPIPKEIDPESGKPYSFLRAKGLEFIEKLSSRLWTDYNIHDPGITILEMLCYAITDLDYRITMSVEDILAQPAGNPEKMHKQFLSAIHALPSCPVSADDYRQMFVRIDGVRNAWMMAADRRIIARYAKTEISGRPELHYKQPGEIPDPEKEYEFRLQGLNNVLIDFDENRLLTPEEKNKDKGTKELIEIQRKQQIINKVKEVYHRYRNLGEDLDTVSEVPLQGVVICGDIDIKPMADPEEVWAQIVFNIDRYLSPGIRYFNLLEMQEMGKPTDEIFEGPVFNLDDGYPYRSGENPFTKKGFICREDLENSELRSEVRLSDIIRIIMETDGVRLVKGIEFGTCDCQESDMEKVRQAVGLNKWNLCIAPGHKPVFCTGNSVLNLWKDLMPIELKKDEAGIKLYNLRENINSEMTSRITEDIPMPEGRFRNTENYSTIQNDFPEVYGIGEAGLSESAATDRKSQAKQLKAYLLFFEQILANYFAQLSNVSLLLSADNSVARTYFGNAVKGLKEAEGIFDLPDSWKEEINRLMKDNKLDDYVNRKNGFLDHILARFGEQFSEYVFLMYRIYGGDAGRAVIRHKVDFLQDYYNMSTSRGSGFDYYNFRSAATSLCNVTGMEKRISRLLGFNNYCHIPLVPLPYTLVPTHTVTRTIHGEPVVIQCYGWSIQKEGATILESFNKDFEKKADAFEEMGLAALLGSDNEYYRFEVLGDPKKVTFRLFDTSGNMIATHPGMYDLLPGATSHEHYRLASEVRDQLIAWFTKDFKPEGLYVVEHILLRPDFDIPANDHTPFFPVCIEPDGSYCPPLDPYSFRVSAVLPGYSVRLRNKHFRRFAERLIRMETPAHLLPRICFVNEEIMHDFESAFTQWLNSREMSSDPMKQAPDSLLLPLKSNLETMFTVYEEGQLTDCDDDTPEKNPVVLGLSTIGSLESDSRPDE